MQTIAPFGHCLINSLHCSTLNSLILYIYISLFMSNELSIDHGVCHCMCVYVIDIENNRRANWPRTSGNPQFRQNSAEFCRIRQCRKPAKHHRTNFQLTNKYSITYVRFPCHDHGVHAIAPLINRWNTPIDRHKQSFCRY